MTKFLGIISGKGGVGKTVTAINLAATLLTFGRSTVLVDGDLQGSNIAIHLGLHTNEKNLHKVLQHKHSLRESIYKHPSGLLVIPGALSYEQTKKADATKLQDALLELVGFSEIVVVDSSSGYHKDTEELVKALDYAVIVTTPDTSAVSEALKSIRLVQEHGTTILGVIINRVKNHETEMSWHNIQTFLDTPILGVVPEDGNALLAQYLKNPIVYTHPTSDMTRAFKFITAQLIGEPYKEELPAVKQEHEQKPVWHYILRNLGFI